MNNEKNANNRIGSNIAIMGDNCTGIITKLSGNILFHYLSWIKAKTTKQIFTNYTGTYKIPLMNKATLEMC